MDFATDPAFAQVWNAHGRSFSAARFRSPSKWSPNAHQSPSHHIADIATVGEAHRLYGMGMSALQIAARLGFSDRSVFRWLQKPPPVIPPSRPPASGLCSQVDPELFFGDRGSHAAAKAVCACCPVLSECREYGIAHPDQSGIWGGMSQNQRRLAHEQS